MKKVLFATTALVASAGIAAADGHKSSTGVSVSGGAEMGVFGGEVGNTTTELQFFTSVDVRFSMTGETKNGVSFGATIDLDDAVDHALLGYDPVDNVGGQFADYTVFVSGAFGTLTMGDTDGALDWAMAEVDTATGAGTIDDAHTFHAGFNGNASLDGRYDGQVARYDYSFAGFSLAISAEIDDSGVNDPVFGIGGKYDADLGGVALAIGAGYQSDGTNDIIGVSVSGGISGITGVLNYSDHSGNGLNTFDSHIGVGIGYEMGAVSVEANYGLFSGSGAANDADGFGIAANYDLGGGAVVQAGFGTGTNQANVESTQYSLGIAMSF